MDAPQGTVTLVFTDIQGSTQLWEVLGNAFRPVLELHNRLMREAIARHGGHEVKTEGDSFMVAFAHAADALAFALDAQQALHDTAWPEALASHSAAAPSTDGTFRGLRVRMGMHTGEPIVEDLPGGVDYFGPMVNRAARVAAAAHGGQVLLSARALEQAGRPQGCELLDLGEHRLKGLDQLEHIWQALPVSLAGRRYAPIATVTQRLNNLPAQLTSFIGRDDQIAELTALLMDNSARLITLLAPGGTGKTRLSLRVGEELLEHFDGGVWFADLTESRDANALALAVAQAFGVPLTTGEDPVLTVGRMLQVRKPLLLILDNFEQVVDAAAATVGRWLRECPHLKCLATSRFLLGIAGEREYALPPLRTPPRIGGERQPTEKLIARLSGYDSVRLFIDRAVQVHPAFSLTRESADDVAGICGALEGLPLAIELAAARVRVMPPSRILQNLGKRFDLLKSSRRDLTDRQRTMEGAIQWSFELLDETEASVLHQCVVFHGGFTLDAVDAVIDAGDGFGLDVIQALRDKSFLRSWQVGDELRFGMFESIREFLLRRSPADEAAAERHARYYTDQAAALRHAFEGAGAADAARWLSIEAANMEAALEARGSVAAALAFNEMLRLRGPFARRVPILERALAAAAPGDIAHVKTALSRAHQDTGNTERAVVLAAEALDAATDDDAKVNALCRVATLRFMGGQLDDALETLARAEALARHEHRLAFVRTCRGPMLRRIGRIDEAEADFLEARRIESARGNAAGAAINMLNLGNLYRATGRTDEALQCYEDARQAQAGLDNKAMLALLTGNIGIVHLEAGRPQQALESFQAAEDLHRETGNPAGIGRNRGNWGGALRDLGRHDEALACFHEAETALRAAGDTLGAVNNALNAASQMLLMERHHEALLAADQVRNEFEALGLKESVGWLMAMEVAANAEAGLGRKDQSRIIARSAIEHATRAGLEDKARDPNVTRVLRKMRELDS